MKNDLGDLLFEARAAQHDLVGAIAALYRVPRATIAIQSFYCLDPLPDDVTVLMYRDDKRGDYPLHLSFWPRSVSLPVSRLEGVRFLTRTLDAACILDDPANAALWICVHPDGRIESVIVDDDAVDNGDVYAQPLVESTATA